MKKHLVQLNKKEITEEGELMIDVERELHESTYVKRLVVLKEEIKNQVSNPPYHGKNG